MSATTQSLTVASTAAVIEQAWAEMQARYEQLTTNATTTTDFTQVVVVVDEGFLRSANRQRPLPEVLAKVADLARLGRSTRVFLAVTADHLSPDLLPADVRNNLTPIELDRPVWIPTTTSTTN